LACYHCNSHKGPNLSGIDPATDQVTVLFNPRTQNWDEHFTFADVAIVGRTATGRATVRVLEMNASDRLQLRAELKSLNALP